MYLPEPLIRKEKLLPPSSFSSRLILFGSLAKECAWEEVQRTRLSSRAKDYLWILDLFRGVFVRVFCTKGDLHVSLFAVEVPSRMTVNNPFKC